jgi:tetratricopeptide (TPR) repeat protein
MSELDAEELFHLAMKASEEGDREKTISYLKRSIARQPQAKSIYILAAEYAELGMMQRAIEGMQRAVELEPTLWTAHFQLGLLFLSQTLIQEAKNAWEPLIDLGPDAYLYHFAVGCIQLIDDKTEDALESFATGVEMNDDNPALNRDIANIVNSVMASGQSDAVEASGAVAAPNGAAEHDFDDMEPVEDEDVGAKRHLLLSKYGESGKLS